MYLVGAKFDLNTDLREILTTKQLKGRHARWVTFLQEYDFTPIHIKGVHNTVSDSLSRRPYDITHTECDDAIDKFPDILTINSLPYDYASLE